MSWCIWGIRVDQPITGTKGGHVQVRTMRSLATAALALTASTMAFAGDDAQAPGRTKLVLTPKTLYRSVQDIEQIFGPSVFPIERGGGARPLSERREYVVDGCRVFVTYSERMRVVGISWEESDACALGWIPHNTVHGTFDIVNDLATPLGDRMTTIVEHAPCLLDCRLAEVSFERRQPGWSYVMLGGALRTIVASDCTGETFTAGIADNSSFFAPLTIAALHPSRCDWSVKPWDELGAPHIADEGLAPLDPLRRRVLRDWLDEHVRLAVIDVATCACQLTGESSPYIALGDFNGDGHEDLAVLLRKTHTERLTLAVFNGPIGAGKAEAALVAADGWDAQSGVVLTAFDVEGRDELAIGLPQSMTREALVPEGSAYRLQWLGGSD
jgi:hypothetical protein